MVSLILIYLFGIEVRLLKSTSLIFVMLMNQQRNAKKVKACESSSRLFSLESNQILRGFSSSLVKCERKPDYLIRTSAYVNVTISNK